MNTVTIRKAGEQDLDALDGLYFEFHQFHARCLPDRLRSLIAVELNDWSELHWALERIFADANAALFVAVDGAQPVGLAEVYLRMDDVTNNRIVPYHYAYVQSLVVSENWREKGVGRQLMQAAEQWAKGKGATEVRLDIWEFAEGPLTFYEKVGYRTLRRTLVKEITDEPAGAGTGTARGPL